MEQVYLQLLKIFQSNSYALMHSGEPVKSSCGRNITVEIIRRLTARLVSDYPVLASSRSIYIIVYLYLILRYQSGTSAWRATTRARRAAGRATRSASRSCACPPWGRQSSWSRLHPGTVQLTATCRYRSGPSAWRATTRGLAKLIVQASPRYIVLAWYNRACKPLFSSYLLVGFWSLIKEVEP